MSNAKFSIRPYQQSSQMNQNGALETWQSLDSAITQIHEQNASLLSFEELYRKAYNMVLYKHGGILYQKLNEKVSGFLQDIARKLSAVDSSQLLSAIITRWTDHKVSMGMIRDILMYLDRTYVPKEKLPPVYECGLSAWLEHVLHNDGIKEAALAEALSCIARERQNEDADRVVLRKFTSMYCEISKQAYVNDFEHPMLVASRQHFKLSAAEFISTNSVSDYLTKAQAWIESEGKRAESYLDPSTKPKLLNTLYDEVLVQHLDTMLMHDSGCTQMLRDEKWQDLGRLYSMLLLIKDLGVIEKLSAAVYAYIDKVGMDFVSDSSKTGDAVQYIDGLLQMKIKFTHLVENHFQGDKLMVKMLHSAFEHFVNHNQRSPEFLSLYMDEKMRKGLAGMMDDEVEAVLCHALGFFRYLQEKDLFERYYKQHLAKRLLGGKTEDDEHESAFLRKLKQECGVQFTSKLEGMFQDTRATHDLVHEFKEHVARNPDMQRSMRGIDLSVNVLTTGYWPTQNVAALPLPPPVQSACEVFKTFYLQKHNTRRLEFQTHMGHVDLRVHMPKKRYNLNVPVSMMVILMLFNTEDKLEYKEIAEMTQIPKTELDRALLQLSLGKLKILTKTPKEKAITGADVFGFNESFSAPHTKLKIQASKTSAGERDTLPTRSAIMEDRKHEIDAAIVRIMKARKELQHNQLTSEAILALTSRFKADPRDIKKRIEHLIEREFLERIPGDIKVYKYCP